ncbi:MAG: elongation factor Ts [Gammaproteobacteria bacterium]|nr:elongation factor Ts [Gammaproteobacteria bacterium]
MSISAAMVKELRERTNAGMMECKKALTETNGDIEAAVELMRKSGAAKADKKAGRIAAEGIIAMEVGAGNKSAVLVEVNSETDFVAKGDDFRGFAAAVAHQVLAGKPADLNALMALPVEKGSDATIETRRRDLISKIGENVNVRRFARYETDGVVGAYLHGNRIGVLVEMKGGDAELAKDIAMHIAASRPVCVSSEQVPAELIAKEKEIFAAQAAESGKPADIIEKMVLGRVAKYLKEVTLLGQPFVKNPEVMVEKLLAEKKATVLRFERIEVGEGIEKKEEDFVAEVMAQAKGA